MPLVPRRRLVLDKFVYDASAPPKSISITLAKGAFRFITGASDKAAYEIKTPTATMGVRGTVFDVFVADNGESIVLLHEGSVEVCAGLLNCKRHNVVGKIIHIGLGGILSDPDQLASLVAQGRAAEQSLSICWSAAHDRPSSASHAFGPRKRTGG